MRLCDEWYRNNHRLTTLPSHAEIKLFDDKLKGHLASCKTCREELKRYEKVDDRAGNMPIALVAFIADAAERMAPEGTTRTKKDLTYYVLRVLEDWKLITWNEPMLQIREDWAGRLGD